ncbi:hypothetical protein COLO4_15209 [Corchorus olitorius]|uniref:Uncharacterized protein n=1 Tax=Corchorus olitorius TaxID=93759 RepID=A0A1R3JNZ3_9ROSI|nr:hypothetical protein COLO4_15209 [Corchorus olitorius]
MAFKIHPNARLDSLVSASTLIPREYHQISLDLVLPKRILSLRWKSPIVRRFGRGSREACSGVSLKRKENARYGNYFLFLFLRDLEDGKTH